MYYTIYGKQTMSENPLKQYFRTPAIHLDLPSKGKFYEEGAIELPETGEVPVFPMTAIDEITYKTPDALFNGSAIVEVIKSCIPAIKDPWGMPATDITSILAAIRIASFGHEMDIATTCPKCEETADYGIDLRNLLENTTVGDYDTPIKIGDLSIFVKPLSYRGVNENNQVQFNDQQIAKVLGSSDLSEEEQLKVLSETFKKISDYTLKSLVKSIKRIKTADDVVTDEKFIEDFLRNCENKMFKHIQSEIIKLKSTENIKPLQIKCDSCGHEYEQPFTLDMTSFFDQDS